MSTLTNTVTTQVESAKIRARSWLHRKIEDVLIMTTRWLLSHRVVQQEIASVFMADTPMCYVLDRAIRERVQDIKEDIEVLDQDDVEKMIDDAFEGRELDARDIEGLDNAIEEAIEEALCGKEFAEHIRDAMIQALLKK